MILVLGLAGPPGAGKETFTNATEKLLRLDGYSVSRHRFSDILRETLTLWGISHGRENEQLMAQIMNRRDGFKEGALTRAVKNRLSKDKADVGILDGVRWLSDEQMIKDFPKEGIASLVVSVNASSRRRFEWMAARNRAGAKETSWEDFLKQEQAPNEIYIPEIRGRADVKLENGGTLEEFEAKIAEAYRQAIRPLLEIQKRTGKIWF